MTAFISTQYDAARTMIQKAEREFLADFSRLLLARRTKLGLTQKQLAEKVGLTRMAYVAMENGCRHVKLIEFVAIAKVMWPDEELKIGGVKITLPPELRTPCAQS